jgi:hypothetical protein
MREPCSFDLVLQVHYTYDAKMKTHCGADYYAQITARPQGAPAQ